MFIFKNLKKIVVILFLVIFMGGCTTDPPRADPLINDTVKQYLAYCAQCDWDRALQMLTGEALLNAKNNLNKNPARLELLINSITVKNYDENGTYAQALADVTVKLENNNDRQFYKFDLIKHNGQWKIYDQGEIIPELTGPMPSESIPARIEQTASNYINLAAKGQWVEASSYLTGQALRTAQLHNRNVQTNTSANNIKVSPIGHQNNIWLIKASYTLLDQQFIVVLKVLDLEQPRIAEINLAKGGD